MRTPSTITRKEIVALCGHQFTERTLCNNEKEWGFFSLRVPFSKKPVLYKRFEAILQLERLMGWRS